MKRTVQLLIALMLCISCVFAMGACDDTTTPVSTGNQTPSNSTEATTDASTEPQPSAPSAPADVVVPAGTKNALVIRYTVNGNNTVTATVSAEGDVAFAGLTGDLNYDASVLTPVSSETILSGMVVNTGNAGAISFSYAAISDITSTQQLFKVTFSYSGTVNTNLTFSIDPDDFCNASFENVSYATFGETLTIG